LREITELPLATRNAIRRVEASLAQAGPLLQRTPIVVVVHNGDTNFRKQGAGWTMPLRELGRTGVRRTVLLAENRTDAELYLVCARHYAVHAKLGSCRVVAEARGGGGSDIVQNFLAIVDERLDWCLCITDGDVLCPASGHSPTSEACEDIAQMSNWI